MKKGDNKSLVIQKLVIKKQRLQNLKDKLGFITWKI